MVNLNQRYHDVKRPLKELDRAKGAEALNELHSASGAKGIVTQMLKSLYLPPRFPQWRQMT